MQDNRVQGEAFFAMQRALGHEFYKPDLLAEALTHRSALSGRKGARRRVKKPVSVGEGSNIRGQGSNERLEFLGDRVLGLLMAEWLYECYPDEQEGALGARHAHLVSRPVLADIAEQIGLPGALSIASHEENTGIRQLSSLKADAMEALLGALFLDAGLEPARRVVRRLWGARIENAGRPHKEPKTLLQEFLLGQHEALPCYEVVSAEGPSHAPVFCVEVRAMGQVGYGQAGNKRHAETAAAVDLLNKLGQENYYV